MSAFAALRPGNPVTVKIAASVPASVNEIKNAVQVSYQTLRVSGHPLPSHLVPRFLTWEDPEYNRRLTTLTARKEKTLSIGGQAVTFALVADRRDYNPSGTVAFTVIGTPRADLSDRVKYRFHIVGSDGVQKQGGADIVFPLNTLPDANQSDLEYMRGIEQLTPGQTLRITAKLYDKDNPPPHAAPEPVPVLILELDLNIVAQPVTPTPEAAYAILRRSRGIDECVRFAWGPLPTRIEFLDPNDLNGQTVRRRAIFTTIDPVNASAQTRTKYALQKTTTNGATHFPDLGD